MASDNFRDCGQIEASARPESLVSLEEMSQFQQVQRSTTECDDSVYLPGIEIDPDTVDDGEEMTFAGGTRRDNGSGGMDNERDARLDRLYAGGTVRDNGQGGRDNERDARLDRLFAFSGQPLELPDQFEGATRGRGTVI